MSVATSPTKVANALSVLAIVSLLGEGPSGGATTRVFRGRPVLAATLERVSAALQLDAIVVLAWDDQIDAVRRASPAARIHACGARRASAMLASTNAALRWADGWRGGLLGVTEFDRGYDAAAVASALDEYGADAAMLISATAVLIGSATLDALVDRLAAQADRTYVFAPGAPGTGAMLLSRAALNELSTRNALPGSLLAYQPDRPQHDPLAKAHALPVRPRVARTTYRLTADSDRQTRRLSLLGDDANEAIDAMEASPAIDAMPREVVIELTTRRATRPAWSSLSLGDIGRPDLTPATAQTIFDQLGSIDDVRVTFAGVGDPLLHPQFDEILAAARGNGLNAIHVDTDLLPENPGFVEALMNGVDVVSCQLPAVYAATYAELMNADRMRDVLENIKRLMHARARGGGGVPILVPTFVKCERNVGEMEAWYDQWIRAVGSASITGPGDFGGRLPYVGVADMTPGTRGPCRRLTSRLTILSDGSVASCEEDVRGEQSCGRADRLGIAWQDGLSMLRSLHGERRWDEAPLCHACRMWDRP